MTTELSVLCGTAVSIGFLHTLLGPDHYVPFVAMSSVGRWSAAKTLSITLLCGLAHVLGSVVLGLVGIAAGVAVFRLETLESHRGDIAGWMLIGFGLAYFVWGLRRAVRRRPHSHVHVHSDGTVHAHRHVHDAEHHHVHASESEQIGISGESASESVTPWVLFTIFGFGPCEPLIPLLMYPAASGSVVGVAVVTALFGIATIATMTVMVLIGKEVIEAVPLGRWGRFGHALAGIALLACGAAIKAGL